MKNNKSLKIALAVVLCLAMLLPFIPQKYSSMTVEADAAVENFTAIGEDFKGKKISILGDSISTFAGVSNDGTANSSISGNAVYYTEDNDYGVDLKDTWWQQAIDTFGLDLCVNNSWSGSRVFGTDATDDYTAAWSDRCVQLHDASGDPDIIAVYLGTNDIKNLTTRLTRFEGDDRSTMISEATGTSTDVNEFSLYIRMIEKMRSAYPDAEIYLFTLLPNESQTALHTQVMEDYNQSIRNLVTYYQGTSNDKVYLVDLYNDTGITNDLNVLNTFLANNLHPNAAGMDAITRCFLSSLQKNSGSTLNPDNWRDIEYDMTDAYVVGGQINSMLFSSSTDYPVFLQLVPTQLDFGLDVKVEALKAGTTDSWDDITSSTYSGGTVCIKRLSYGDYSKVRITAKAVYDTNDYRWELKDGSLESVVADGKDHDVVGGIDYNDATMLSGSHDGTVFADAQFEITDPIILRNEEPWVLEWKASGSWSGGSILLTNQDVDNVRNNSYLFFSAAPMLSLGFWKDYNNGGDYPKGHTNFGVSLSGITLNDSTSHVYRLVNEIAADGSNMVYLFVDGTQIGAMNNYYQGSNAKGFTDNWVSGKDFVFNFFGSDATQRPVRNTNIEYIQVWEGGDFNTLRLQQLIQEYDELSVSMADANGFEAYQTAVNNAKTYLESNKDRHNNQETYDNYVSAIITARNDLTTTAGSTKIHSMELINRNFVAIDKPAGVKIVTSPDITHLKVGTDDQELLVHSSSIQTIKIDGTDTEVKVWLLSWDHGATAEKIYNYRIYAYTANGGWTSSEIMIPAGANCLSELRVTTAPTKTEYKAGETFDTTGMVVKACYGDGLTTKVVTNYTVTYQNGSSITASDTYVILEYTEAAYGTVTVKVPVTVTE